MVWYADLFNSINLGLGGRAKQSQQLARFKNRIEFQNAFARLVKKGLARYKFEGLPETISDRVLKQALLYHGSVCFFEKEGSVLALPACPTSDLTLYGDFKSCFCYGRNGYNIRVPLYVPGADEAPVLNKGVINGTPEPKGVFVRENEIVYPFVNYCISYAEKISDTMRTLDVTRRNIKRPFVVTAEEQVVPTVKKFFDQRDENMEYIISTGIFPADKVNIAEIPYGSENLKACTDLVEWYMNDFDNLCGFNSNANPDKKERLLVDEVNSNNESTNANMDSLLVYLQSQLDLVNKYLGTDITVIAGKQEPDNPKTEDYADALFYSNMKEDKEGDEE